MINSIDLKRKKIILASMSPRRAELLEKIGVDFSVKVSDVDEYIEPLWAPCEAAEKLAIQKAVSVAKEFNENELIIGGDTIVVTDKILGKPKNEVEAFEMLSELNGKWHEVITGVALVSAKAEKIISGYEITRVKMKSLTAERIRAYIKTGEPMDKAGSYGIQCFGSVLIERIDGCFYNVVGLPLSRLDNMLQQFDIKLL